MKKEFNNYQTHNNTLNGERIKQINLDGDTELYITTDKGIHCFHVTGDCCSCSYFYEINNIHQMVTWVVKDIEEIDMPEVPEDQQNDCTQAYGYKIHTEGGYGLIVFRNDSNGYYGGTLEYYGLVDEAKGKEIWEDWNA
jgi:hypothetical protein